MELTHIDLGKLTLSAINMRHGKQPPDVSDILPSIRARGVLVPLLVRPNGADDHFEIIAGRRRYFAAKAVAEEGADIDTLPCAVMAPGDDAAALEASLIENLARLDPEPMTQFETFARLTKEGRSVAEIAATFGITEIMVKRRLALGDLLPKIREAYRNDQIDDDSIRQLTLASKAQQRAWLKLFEDAEHYVPMGQDLKAWLFGGHEIPTEVALFPLDRYAGQIVTDLFGEQSYFADTDQFWRLQNEAIAAKRDALVAEGWPEVIIYEPGQRFHEWQHTPTAKDQGGRVYVTVTRGGEVEIHEGYLTRKEARRVRQASQPSERPSDGTAATPARCEMSKSMQNYLELHRHAAVRVELLQHPGVALRLMVAHAIAGSGLWQVECEPQRAGSEAIAESIDQSRAQAAFAEARRRVEELLGSSSNENPIELPSDVTTTTAAIFARLLSLSDDEVLQVLAYAMADSLEAGTAVLEAVGNHLRVDMGKHWQPDDVFFDLLRRKAVVNAILAEIAGKAVADQNVSQKVATQKKIIQDSLAGANGRQQVESWLPGYLAFPFRAYTDQGGGRIEAAWQSVTSHIQ